jgi:hypothetical protein
MKSSLVLATAALLCCGFTSPQESADKKAFDRFKTLVGDWTGKAGEVGGQMGETKVSYKLVGGGTTLVETLFGGEPHEMISMYHMDGDSLMMTHYCAAGNQPTFKLKPGKDKDTYVLDFAKGSNMKPNDMHMHTVEFKFDGPDHVTATWTSYMDGKSAGAVQFDIKRDK